MCDFLKHAFKKGVDSARPFDGEFDYFDRTFSYTKLKDDSYEARFSVYGKPQGFQFKENTLSESYLTTARKQQGFYREVFDVYRINVEAKVLVHSYVYYLHPEDYNKNFNKPEFTSYNQPSLFDLVNRKTPEGYVKIGWDKTKWQCYDVSYFKYLLLSVEEFIIRVFVGGIT